MHVAVYLPFVLSALLAVLAPVLSTRLAPATAARLLLLAGLACALSSVVALGALAATAAGRVPVVAGLAGWSWHVVRRDDPVHPWIGAASALLLMVVSLLTVREVVRRGLALYRSWHTCRELTGSLVVLDDPAPDAYALPGGRIVVSRGMLQALSGDERRVMLAHETAHIRHRHYLYRAGARLGAAVNPILWTLPGAIQHATERWADEVAAEQVGDRRLAARALAHAALATSRTRTTGAAGHTAERTPAERTPAEGTIAGGARTEGSTAGYTPAGGSTAAGTTDAGTTAAGTTNASTTAAGTTNASTTNAGTTAERGPAADLAGESALGGDGAEFGGHDVTRRVQALLDGRPERRPLATSLLAGMILALVVTTHEVGSDADAFFDHAAVHVADRKWSTARAESHGPIDGVRATGPCPAVVVKIVGTEKCVLARLRHPDDLPSSATQAVKIVGGRRAGSASAPVGVV